MTSYPVFDEFQKKQEEILEELERVRELSLLHDIGQSMHTLTWRRPWSSSSRGWPRESGSTG